jgi:hypothetical protein
MTVAIINRGLRRKSSKVLPGSKKILTKVEASVICGGSSAFIASGGGGACHSTGFCSCIILSFVEKDSNESLKKIKPEDAEAATTQQLKH